MSTRYVWSKGSTEYVDTVQTGLSSGWSSTWAEDLNYIPLGTFSGSSITLDQPTCYRSYTFDKATGRYSGSGASRLLDAGISNLEVGIEIQNRISPSDVYPYIVSADGQYIYLWDKRLLKSGVVDSDDTVYWTRFVSGKNQQNNYIPSSANNAICVSMVDQDADTNDYYVLGIVKVRATETTSTEKVSSNNSGAYSGSDYTYLGSDSIDPLSISYPTSGVNAGDSITVTVTPGSNTYGGTVSYLYQYNTGSGWVTIQTTTATSIQFTIPSNASSIQFRVRAQDSWGFASDDYVTGPNVTLGSGSGGGDVGGAGKVWIGVGNTAKQATGVWVGVNGTAKKVTAMWVGVNGIAKKVF